MSGPLPALQDARQLHRLRTLRVQRAREAVAAARDAVARAEQAVAARERSVAAARQAIEELASGMLGANAVHLPRWKDVAAAERGRRTEHLEREADSLIGDRKNLKDAQQALAAAHAELDRAIAREDVTAGLVRDVQRARVAAAEQRAETEQEDQGRPGPRVE